MTATIQRILMQISEKRKQHPTLAILNTHMNIRKNSADILVSEIAFPVSQVLNGRKRSDRKLEQTVCGLLSDLSEHKKRV